MRRTTGEKGNNFLDIYLAIFDNTYFSNLGRTLMIKLLRYAKYIEKEGLNKHQNYFANMKLDLKFIRKELPEKYS